MARRGLARHVPGVVRRSPARLRQLAASDIVLLAAAPAALPLLAVGLRRLGLRRVMVLLAGQRSAAFIPDEASAERLAWIVKVAARYGPWPANCLQRSVLLWWYLRIHGLNGDLRIGVRRDPETNSLDFHAWVEHGSSVLNDGADLRQRYATFDQAVAPRNATFH
jgi:hypothetical protein